MKEVPTEPERRRIATFEASAEISPEANATEPTENKKVPKIFFRPAYSGGFLDLDKKTWPYPTVFDIAGIERVDVLPILRDHKNENAVGQTTKIEFSDAAINADGVILYAGVNPAADAVLAAWKNGAKLQASVRTGLIDAQNIEFIEEGATGEANGRTFAGPCEIVRKLKLREISVVNVGADDETSVEIQAALETANDGKTNNEKELNKMGKTKKNARNAAAEIDDETPKNAQANATETDENKSAACSASFEEYLAALGLNAETLSEAEINVLQLAFDAANSAAAQSADDDASKSGAAGGSDDDPAKTGAAEEDGDDATKTGAASLGGLGAFYGARRPASATSIQNRTYQSFRGAGLDGAPHVCRVAEAALMQTGGLSEDALKVAGFSDAEIDAAQNGQFARLSIKGLLFRSGVASLADFNSDQNIATNLSVELQRSKALPGYSPGKYRTARAAGTVSAMDAPNIFANVMYKSMLVGQKSIKDPTNKLSKVVTAKDFRPMLFYDLLLSGDFEDVKDNGELSSLKATDKGYENQAELKGFEFRIKYQDLINDNTSALTDVPNRMGRKALLRKQRIWWETLAASTSRFPTVSGNPVFGLSGVSKALAKLKGAKDADKDLLGIRGKYLLVPPALENEAFEIQHATSVVAAGGSESVIRANANNLAGRFETIASDFIGSEGPVSSWTDAAYALIADPADLPVMIVSYLNGNQGPNLQTVNGEFEIEGLRVGCWWGFGISLGEPKGGVYSSGAGK